MAPTQRYARVPTTEEDSKAAANKKRRSEAAENIATKIQALAWVATGVFVAYQTDLPFVMLSHPDVNRFWFNIAASCFTMNTVLCAYLTLWLPYVQRVTTEWAVYCPRVIWPVWGLLTTFIRAIIFLACLMSLHFIEWPF